jgi:hypothetical protein
MINFEIYTVDLGNGRTEYGIRSNVYGVTKILSDYEVVYAKKCGIDLVYETQKELNETFFKEHPK